MTTNNQPPAPADVWTWSRPYTGANAHNQFKLQRGNEVVATGYCKSDDHLAAICDGMNRRSTPPVVAAAPSGEVEEALSWADSHKRERPYTSPNINSLKVLAAEVRRLRELHLERTKLTDRVINERDQAREELKRATRPTTSAEDLPVPDLSEPAGTILVGSQQKRAYLFVNMTARRMRAERANAAAHGVQDMRDFVFVLNGERFEMTFEELHDRLSAKPGMGD